MDTIARRFARVPGAVDHTIRGDNARPETINELKRRGFKVKAAPKWKGSVEDGVEYLRSFEEIILHPRCKGAIQECRLWRYKTDSRTGDVLPKLADGNDHGPDSWRYALAPLLKRGRVPLVWYPGKEDQEETAA
jgi:phage terminase large subunit